ncbi:unnamed protein product, partial [Allacma fusca]
IVIPLNLEERKIMHIRGRSGRILIGGSNIS